MASSLQNRSASTWVAVLLSSAPHSCAICFLNRVGRGDFREWLELSYGNRN